MTPFKRIALLFALPLLGAISALAQDAASEPKIDTGDTSFVLISAALVLFMTIPGLALLYGGVGRAKMSWAR